MEVDCIIKVGGAAITDKTRDVATLNNHVMKGSVFIPSLSTSLPSLLLRWYRVVEMVQQLTKEGLNFILVLGAGSYAHPVVTRHNVAEGGPGVYLARQGVTELGHTVCTQLTNENIPAVLVSPFAMGLFPGNGKRLYLTSVEPHLIRTVCFFSGVFTAFVEATGAASDAWRRCIGSQRMVYPF